MNRSHDFQMELMMVHLDQMNKRLDMLEKTCVVMMEKNVNALHAQQYFEKRVLAEAEAEKEKEAEADKEAEAEKAAKKPSLLRRAAL